MCVHPAAAAENLSRRLCIPTQRRDTGICRCYDDHILTDGCVGWDVRACMQRMLNAQQRQKLTEGASGQQKRHGG